MFAGRSLDLEICHLFSLDALSIPVLILSLYIVRLHREKENVDEPWSSLF